MSDIWQMVIFVLAGMLLAACYFGGLWWTVQLLPHVRHPWLFYFGSTVVRMLVLLTTLFLLMSGDWRRAAACMFGFLMLRLLMLYRVGWSNPEIVVPHVESTPHE